MSAEASAGAEHFTLTPREIMIVCLVAGGLTNAQAARKLHISRHTVAQHIAEMLQRARASNRAELIARAYTEGVLAIDTWPPSPGGPRSTEAAPSCSTVHPAPCPGRRVVGGAQA